MKYKDPILTPGESVDDKGRKYYTRAHQMTKEKLEELLAYDANMDKRDCYYKFQHNYEDCWECPFRPDLWWMSYAYERTTYYATSCGTAVKWIKEALKRKEEDCINLNDQ